MQGPQNQPTVARQHGADLAATVASGRAMPSGTAGEPGSDPAGLRSAEEDARWFLAYGKGDTRAFESLYRKHRGWLHRVILRQVGDEARAQEIFQEVWLSAIRHAADWKPEARFTTWIYQIARNRVVDSWRAQRADPVLPASGGPGPSSRSAPEAGVPEPGSGPIDDPGSQDQDPARLHEQRELVSRVLEVLDQMPPAQREVFLLAVDAGLTLPDVARATGATLEATKSRLRYARARIALALDPWRR